MRDGPTISTGSFFHAWKNVVSESWARVRRRAAAAFVLGALTFSVGACGNMPQETPVPVQAAPVVTAPAAPVFDTTFNDVKPTVYRAAVDKFGAKAAAAGGDMAVAVTEEFAYNQETYAATRPAGQEQVLSITESLTPYAARDWKHTVDVYLNGNKKARDDATSNMFSLTLYDPFHGSARHQGQPLVAQTDGPGLVNQKIKSTAVSLDSGGRLQVEVDSSALLRVTAGGKPFVIKMDRETTYYLVQDAHDDWKIDGWDGHYATGKVLPEK